MKFLFLKRTKIDLFFYIICFNIWDPLLSAFFTEYEKKRGHPIDGYRSDDILFPVVKFEW